MTDTTDFIVEGNDADISDFKLAKSLADKLHAHYPGHLWAVFVNSRATGGVVYIKNLAVSSLYGYVLHLNNVLADPTLKCVMRAGGEILERAKFARGKAKGEFASIVEGKADKHQNFNQVVI